MASDYYAELYAELDDLRAVRDYHGNKCLGISIGPYVQGNTEGGYGGKTLQRIREIRRLITLEERKHHGI